MKRMPAECFTKVVDTTQQQGNVFVEDEYYRKLSKGARKYYPKLAKHAVEPVDVICREESILATTPCSTGIYNWSFILYSLPFVLRCMPHLLTVTHKLTGNFKPTR